jgi:hypothetical protein
VEHQLGAPCFSRDNCGRFTRSSKDTCAGYRISVATLDSAALKHIAEHVFTEERCREILHDFVEDQGILRQKTTDQAGSSSASGSSLESASRRDPRVAAPLRQPRIDGRTP